MAKDNATQDEVNAEKTKIENANSDLNGTTTNKKPLQDLTDESENTPNSSKYYNADEAKKEVFDKAVEEAKAVLAKENVSQTEIDAAKAKLQEAKDALNGADTKKEALQKVSDESATK